MRYSVSSQPPILIVFLLSETAIVIEPLIQLSILAPGGEEIHKVSSEGRLTGEMIDSKQKGRGVKIMVEERDKKAKAHSLL